MPPAFPKVPALFPQSAPPAFPVPFLFLKRLLRLYQTSFPAPLWLRCFSSRLPPVRRVFSSVFQWWSPAFPDNPARRRTALPASEGYVRRRYGKASSGTPHQKSACGCCSFPFSYPVQGAALPVLPTPFPAGGITPHTGFCNRIHGAHGYAVSPRPDGAPSPEDARGNQNAGQTLHKTHSQSGTRFPAGRIPPPSQSGKCFPPGRSYCSLTNPPPCGCVPCAGSSRSLRSGLQWNPNNSRCNKPVLSAQSWNPAGKNPPGSRRWYSPGSSPSIHFSLPAPNQYDRCFPRQSGGHCGVGCTCRFCRSVRCAVSVSIQNPPFLFTDSRAGGRAAKLPNLRGLRQVIPSTNWRKRQL